MINATVRTCLTQVSAPVCLLAAPESIERFCDLHPDVPLYTAAIDDHLDEHGYIIPGLGDTGNRLFDIK